MLPIPAAACLEPEISSPHVLAMRGRRSFRGFCAALEPWRFPRCAFEIIVGRNRGPLGPPLRTRPRKSRRRALGNSRPWPPLRRRGFSSTPRRSLEPFRRGVSARLHLFTPVGEDSLRSLRSSASCRLRSSEGRSALLRTRPRKSRRRATGNSRPWPPCGVVGFSSTPRRSLRTLSARSFRSAPSPYAGRRDSLRSLRSSARCRLRSSIAARSPASTPPNGLGRAGPPEGLPPPPPDAGPPRPRDDASKADRTDFVARRPPFGWIGEARRVRPPPAFLRVDLGSEGECNFTVGHVRPLSSYRCRKNPERGRFELRVNSWSRTTDPTI